MTKGAAQGFTLLELLVVLAVIALMAVVAAPRFAGSLLGAQLDAGARELASGLREARSRAVSLNRDVPFVLDGDAKRYRIGARGRGRPLPDRVEISLITGTAEIAGSRRGAIRFFPDGSATGGRIELAAPGATRRITVDWLTGRIRLED